jgi:DNA repair exonuclease SbcCD ATPase subunit
VAAPHTETMTAADLAATVRDALDRWTQGYHVQIADMPKIAQARAALAELQAQAERTKLADYRETHEELTARAEAAEAERDRLAARVAELEQRVEECNRSWALRLKHGNDAEARVTELEAALVEHHAVGVMDDVVIGDRCPVCAELAGEGQP